jgi:hypothetical protein
MPTFADLCLLSSSIHRHWVLTYGSTMRTDAVHAIDCFDPFPFPRRFGLSRTSDQIYDHRCQSASARRRITHLQSLQQRRAIRYPARDFHAEMDSQFRRVRPMTDLSRLHDIDPGGASFSSPRGAGPRSLPRTEPRTLRREVAPGLHAESPSGGSAVAREPKRRRPASLRCLPAVTQTEFSSF